MAKLKIYSFPDKVLSEKAAPIHRVEKSLHRIADDMLETMYHAPGIGLAANQVGILQRILVIDVEYHLEDSSEVGMSLEGEFIPKNEIQNKKPQILINPEIIYREGSILFSEACLSVPEYSADVKRSKKLKLSYQDLDGVVRKLSAEGLLAVCIQHEIDHLDGKLFIDRLSPLKKEIVKKKLKLERAQREMSDFEDLHSLKETAPKKNKGF